MAILTDLKKLPQRHGGGNIAWYVSLEYANPAKMKEVRQLCINFLDGDPLTRSRLPTKTALMEYLNDNGIKVVRSCLSNYLKVLDGEIKATEAAGRTTKSRKAKARGKRR